MAPQSYLIQRQSQRPLQAEYPDDESMRVSRETIYRSLFVQARGVLKRQLLGHLRSKRVTRRSRNLNPEAQSRGQIVGAVSIRERPAEVEDRAIPGHWEGDLLLGSKNSHIVTRHPQSTLDRVALRLNQRPRETLGFKDSCG
jgi:IS30 family transposase